MKSFNIVVAIDSNLGIGKNGSLPWHIPGDMQHFKELTTMTVDSRKKNAVILGRKTWESLPAKFRPLPERLNVVVTRNSALALPDGVIRASNLHDVFLAIDKKEFGDKIETVYVIGGGEIFKEAVKNPQCKKIYLTQIRKQFDCDVFFPEFRDEFKETLTSPPFSENGIEYHFAIYSRP